MHCWQWQTPCISAVTPIEPEPLMCDGDGPVPMARERYNQFLSTEAFEKAKGKTRRIETKLRV